MFWRVLVLVCCVSASVQADGVLSTALGPAGTPPELTVVQDTNAFGQPFYARIVEDVVNLDVEVYGGCNANWRVHAARVGECANISSSGTEEVCAGDAETTWFSQTLDVDTKAKKVGPRIESLEVPTSFLTDVLTAAGEELIATLAAGTPSTAAAWRAVDLRIPVDWRLRFVMTCRRWFLNNATDAEASTGFIPINVTYRGGVGEIPPFGLEPRPPGAPVLPIPVDRFAVGTRIEQSQLSLIPDTTRDPCTFHLSGTFTTSEPTEVVYRLVDDKGARSPEFTVETGESKVAYFSHELEFDEGDTSPNSFAIDSGDGPRSAGAIAFAGSFADVPSDRLRGFYRVETSAPHRATSNLVGYNLDRCTAEPAPRSPAFDAVVIDDPDRAAEIFRRAKSADYSSK